MNYLIYDGVDSREYGVFVSFQDIDAIPERDVEEYNISGRNGALTIDKGGYKILDHVYWIIGYGDNYRQFRAYLNEMSRHAGYHRLEDSFEPEEYYSARINGKIDVFSWRNRDMARCELRFIRDPRRFLVSGEEAIALDEAGIVLNPTTCAANPIIKVTGNGTLTIGDQNVVISDAFAETVIDCERQDCYSGQFNANYAVSFEDGKFPELYAGENEVSWTGAITAVEITPRWWRL